MCNACLTEDALPLALDPIEEALYDALHLLTNVNHADSAKWWHHPDTGERKDRNVPEMLMLTVSEIAEAMEGHRKDKMDDHLPHRKMIEVELADALIRIFDISGGLDLDVAGALIEKRRYNQTRADHQREARLAPGGKAY